MNESILLENYEKVEIKGAKKVVSATATQAVIETETKTSIRCGNNLQVAKLDLENNIVSLSGTITALKFNLASGKKPSLLKRIFK